MREKKTNILILLGHSVSQQDTANQPSASAFYSCEGFDFLVQPKEVCQVFNKRLDRASCTHFNYFFNWDAFLQHDRKRMGSAKSISFYQIFQCTPEGTQLYESPTSQPFGPFILSTRTLGSEPDLLQFPSLENDVIKSLDYFLRCTDYLPPEDKDYLNNIISGGLGGEFFNHCTKGYFKPLQENPSKEV